MKFIILILLSIPFVSYSQENCEELLSSEVNNKFDSKEFRTNVVQLTYCSQEFSIDAIRLIDWNLMVNYIVERNTNPTYNDLLVAVNKFQQTEKFKEDYKCMKCERFAVRTPNLKDWNSDKQMLSECGIKDDEIVEIKKRILENNSSLKMSYEELIENKKYFDKPFKNLVAKKVDLSPKYYPDQISRIENSSKKTILYFKSDKSINCIKIEDYVLRDPEVAKTINENFDFICISIDSEKELPEEDWKKRRKHLYKTEGRINLYHQIEDYKTNSQPTFIIVNNKKEAIEYISYTSKNEFMNHLLKNK